jgi:hypothetical protein
LTPIHLGWLPSSCKTDCSLHQRNDVSEASGATSLLLHVGSQMLNLICGRLGKGGGWNERLVGRTLYLADLVFYWRSVSWKKPTLKRRDCACRRRSYCCQFARPTAGREALRLNFTSFKKRNSQFCSDTEQSLSKYLASGSRRAGINAASKKNSNQSYFFQMPCCWMVRRFELYGYTAKPRSVNHEDTLVPSPVFFRLSLRTIAGFVPAFYDSAIFSKQNRVVSSGLGAKACTRKRQRHRNQK